MHNGDVYNVLKENSNKKPIYRQTSFSKMGGLCKKKHIHAYFLR